MGDLKGGYKEGGEDGWGNGDKEHNLSNWESGGSFFLCGNLINKVSPSAEGFLDKTLILKNHISKKEREKHKNTEEKKRFQQFSLDSDGEHACRVARLSRLAVQKEGADGGVSLPLSGCYNKLIETSPKALSLFCPFPLENRQSTFAVINELPHFRIPMIIK